MEVTKRFENLGYLVLGNVDTDKASEVLQELENVRKELVREGFNRATEWMEVLHNTYPEPYEGVKSAYNWKQQ